MPLCGAKQTGGTMGWISVAGGSCTVRVDKQRFISRCVLIDIRKMSRSLFSVQALSSDALEGRDPHMSWIPGYVP